MSEPKFKGFSYLGHSTNDQFSPRTGDSGGVTNHFEIPNMSSMLYDFTNKEKDLVEK